MRLATLVLIFFGEALVIYAEEFGAKGYAAGGSFSDTFARSLVPLAVGALFLVSGYMLGLKHFSNIWVVTAVSFGSILLVEPLFDYFYIGQLPTLGAFIGFALAVLGIAAALFIP